VPPRLNEYQENPISPYFLGPWVVMTFDIEQNALLAFKEWSANKELLLYIAHELNCNNGHPAISKVVTMDLDAAAIIVQYDTVDFRDIVQEYLITFAEHETQPRSLNLNYDELTGYASNTQVQFYSTSSSNIKCVDCYTLGEARIYYVFR
jgi:hypothetical protein